MENQEAEENTEEEELSREWVMDYFRIRDNPIIKANPEVGEELIQTLQKKGQAFEGGAVRDQVIGQGVAGRTDWIVVRVELKPGEETPVNMKQRAMNPDDSTQLTAQLKLWQEQDLIRPIDSEWKSAPLSVAKKNTAAKRFIIDLRPLNAKCKKINLYIGSVEQNLQKLHGIEVVSTIDMSNGFGVLPIAEEDQHYFAFTTPNQGSWAFKRLPNGWVNSPAYYTRYMARLISTLPVGKVLSYIDDVLLYSEDPTGRQMVRLIGKFLDRVIQSGGKINVAKSEFLRTKVKYLGFVVGKNGILMDPKYRQALVDFPLPKLPKALARFLGMVQYYKHFLKDLSKDSGDLHKLKTQTFSEMPTWVVQAFKRIKQSVLNSEALVAPKFTTLQQNPFIVGLDFSIKANGVTLSQVQKGKDGKEHQRLLYCFGRKNTSASQNY